MSESFALLSNDREEENKHGSAGPHDRRSHLEREQGIELGPAAGGVTIAVFCGSDGSTWLIQRWVPEHGSIFRHPCICSVEVCRAGLALARAFPGILLGAKGYQWSVSVSFEAAIER